jgi:predicted transcriptional regulator of viral defense system
MAEVRPDSVALALAARQHGVVTTAQLAQSGLSKDAIADRVRRGWLRRRHRGVYVVGPLETPLTAAMAAVAACGEGALLSHHPAAVLWGMRRPPAGDMHVTVSGRAVHARNGIQIHRANLHPRDITRKHGIPLTSPRERSSTSPPPSLSESLTEPSRKPRCSGASHSVPSISSSAVTRRTEAPRL